MRFSCARHKCWQKEGMRPVSTHAHTHSTPLPERKRRPYILTSCRLWYLLCCWWQNGTCTFSKCLLRAGRRIHSVGGQSMGWDEWWLHRLSDPGSATSFFAISCLALRRTRVGPLVMFSQIVLFLITEVSNRVPICTFFFCLSCYQHDYLARLIFQS